MNDLLTTRQLEDLLKVDRITIYRMLDDGRLKGFKVGGQWRFSRAEVEAWLQERQSAATPEELAYDQVHEVLPLSCIEAIQSVFAEALNLGIATTDGTGKLLNPVANSCDFCNAILATSAGRERCAASWRGQHGKDRCHAGLVCLSADVVVHGNLVAAVSACQCLPTGETLASWMRALPILAQELSLPEEELSKAASTIRMVSPEQHQRLPQLLQRVANTFAQMGRERLALTDRLRRIAEISRIPGSDS